jgi:hypothetical protein
MAPRRGPFCFQQLLLKHESFHDRLHCAHKPSYSDPAMLCKLKRHPDTPSAAVDTIAVEAVRNVCNLRLRYRVVGRIAAINIPVCAQSVHTDELWQHTCFEAFVKEEGAPPYCEFNFAPSTQWAAYSFTGYREGMRALSDFVPSDIDAKITATDIFLQANLLLSDWPNLLPPAIWRLGLSAVIEETNGAKSYWALAHPPGKPDFHHADCFALKLPPASAA